MVVGPIPTLPTKRRPGQTERRSRMRNLIEVIDKIIEVAPELEPHFRSLKSSVCYSSPEVMIFRWDEAAYILNTYALKHERKYEIAAIFSGQEKQNTGAVDERS